jgi:hypothetical protein
VSGPPRAESDEVFPSEDADGPGQSPANVDSRGGESVAPFCR